MGIGLLISDAEKDPSYFQQVLRLNPKSIFLSHGDFTPYCKLVDIYREEFESDANDMKLLVQVFIGCSQNRLIY